MNSLVDERGLRGGPHELGVERLVAPHQVPLEVVRRLVVRPAQVLLARVAGGRAPVLRREVLPYGQRRRLGPVGVLLKLDICVVTVLALGGNSIDS